MSNESMVKAGKILEKKYSELYHKFNILSYAYTLACNELGNAETNCRFCPVGTGTELCERYDCPRVCGESLNKYFLQKAEESLRKEQ